MDSRGRPVQHVDIRDLEASIALHAAVQNVQARVQLPGELLHRDRSGGEDCRLFAVHAGVRADEGGEPVVRGLDPGVSQLELEARVRVVPLA